MRKATLLVRAQYLLAVAGLLALIYCANFILGAQRYQSKAEQGLQTLPAEPIGLRPNANPGSKSSPTLPGPIEEAGFIGKLEIPTAGISAIIAEGAASKVLRLAVGHIPGTAFPWESGNVTLVAHRDTFFRRLGELKIGDTIRILTPLAEYSYRVSFLDVVEPKEV